MILKPYLIVLIIWMMFIEVIVTAIQIKNVKHGWYLMI